LLLVSDHDTPGFDFNKSLVTNYGGLTKWRAQMDFDGPLRSMSFGWARELIELSFKPPASNKGNFVFRRKSILLRSLPLSYLLPEPFAIKDGALLYFYFLHMTARTGNFVPPGWFF
jgi:hypothetical protein